MVLSQKSQYFPELSDVVHGQALFKSNTPIWNSKFADDIWDFSDASKANGRGERTNSILWQDYLEAGAKAKKHHNAERNMKYQRELPLQIIEDLKVTAAIYLYYPKLLKNSRTSKKVIDPKTVKGRVSELLNFLSHLYSSLRDDGFKIASLQEVSFLQLKSAITSYPGRSTHLKRALKLLSDPLIQLNLKGKLQWTLRDIESKSIKWNTVVKYQGIATLPDSMFLFLMNHTRMSIGQFLFAIGEKLNDELAAEKTRDEFVKKYPRLADAIEMKLSPDYGSRSLEYKRCKQDFGYSITDVESVINDVHCSAIMVVMLLTGMRLSEAQYVMRDCLVSENGYQFIKSKLVKQQDKDLPINNIWIATSLVLDAIKVLQILTKYTENPYLISALIPKKQDKEYLMPYTSGGLSTTLKRWLKKIDKEGQFNGWTFSPHQLRETLVFQLARAEVGLPFISMQLKHFQHRFKSIPNDVTAGYGEYKKNLLSDIATKSPQARESVLLEIYGEQSNFAGGAAESHKARIDSFFNGMGLFGEDREQYIKNMAMKGVEIMPTSIGGCTKNFLTINNSTKELPPCYGDFQCDPDCENHLISPSCQPALQNRLDMALDKVNKSTNPEAAKIWQGLSDNLKKHLDKLRIDVKEIG